MIISFFMQHAAPIILQPIGYFFKTLSWMSSASQKVLLAGFYIAYVGQLLEAVAAHNHGSSLRKGKFLWLFRQILALMLLQL